MQRTQTGATRLGQTGKKKNCTSWAEYEAPKASKTADLCNGGWYNGETYNECESKVDCIRDTIAPRPGQDRRYLPIHTNEPRPFGGGGQVIARTPNLLADRLPGWGQGYQRLPTTLPTRTRYEAPSPMQVQHNLPYPIQPPAEWPEAMHTPYAAPTPVLAGGVSPTFLPSKEESVFTRLGKNVMQGAIASTGWHIFDFARTVDLFGRTRGG